VRVLLIGRCNILSGMTSVPAFDDRRLLGSVTHTGWFGAARVCHGVTPVEPLVFADGYGTPSV
jgi:hypothetical protein